LFRKLNEGESFIEGDEYFSDCSGWNVIPVQWVGMVLSYNDNNTLSRMRLPIRRKTSEDSGAGANSTQQDAVPPLPPADGGGPKFMDLTNASVFPRGMLG
jgi:hypothetical protein